MEIDAKATFRLRLDQLFVELDQAMNLARGATQTVTLDQQPIGRLSRMDALQNQAKAKAQLARRAQSRTRILHAVDRLKTGAFGYCLKCRDQISFKRLNLDPAVPKCISCARR